MRIIITILIYVIRAYNVLIIARVLVSWFPVDPYHPIIRFLYDMTEPVLAPIRRVMPQGMMFDFSPIVVLILLFVIESILWRIQLLLF